MKEVTFTGSGKSAFATVRVRGRDVETYKGELAQFVPDFLKALSLQGVAIGPENLVLFIEKFAYYMDFAKDKEEALSLTVNNYVIQLRNISKGNGARFI